MHMHMHAAIATFNIQLLLRCRPPQQAGTIILLSSVIHAKYLIMPCLCSHFIVNVHMMLHSDIIIITMVTYKQCIQLLVRG